VEKQFGLSPFLLSNDFLFAAAHLPLTARSENPQQTSRLFCGFGNLWAFPLIGGLIFSPPLAVLHFFFSRHREYKSLFLSNLWFIFLFPPGLRNSSLIANLAFPSFYVPPFFFFFSPSAAALWGLAEYFFFFCCQIP